MNQCSLELFLFSYRQRQSVGKLRILFFCKNSLCHRHFSQRVIDNLTVIDIGEDNIGALHIPGFIGGDDFLRAVLIVDDQVRDQLPCIAIGGRFGLIKAEASSVPAVAQSDFNSVVFCHQIIQIKGDHLCPEIICGAVWRQMFIADPFSVEHSLKQTAGADIESCPADSFLASE